MSAGEESLKYQGILKWDDLHDSFAVRSGKMTEVPKPGFISQRIDLGGQNSRNNALFGRIFHVASVRSLFPTRSKLHHSIFPFLSKLPVLLGVIYCPFNRASFDKS